MPAWFRELGLSSEEPEAATNAPEGGADVPKWLQELQGSLPEEARTRASEEAEGQVPGWLAELQPRSVGMPETEPEGQEERAPEQADEAEVPDWLAELRPWGPAAAADQEPEGEEEETEAPSWVAELGAADQAAGQAPEPEGEQQEEQIPDWLSEARQPIETAEAELEPEVEPADVPEWLARLRPQTSKEETGQGLEAEQGEAEQPEEIEEAELPDWLTQLRPPAAEASGAPEAEGQEEGLPEWLLALRPEAPGEEPGPEGGAQAEELPDWLAELRPPAPETETVPQAAAGEELPEWLAELGPRATEAEPQAEEETSPTRLGQLPATTETGEVEQETVAAAEELQRESPEQEIPGEPEEIGKPEAAGEEATDGELEQGAAMPEWLADVRAGLPPESELPDEEALAEAEIPDWLVPTERDSKEDVLVRAEIPGWLLELKPRELKAEEEEQEGLPAEGAQAAQPGAETGLLAGIQGTLPIEMLIAQPRAAAMVRPSGPAAADAAPASLFEQIVAAPAVAPSRVLAQPVEHKLSRIVQWILAAALIAAVTIPLLLKDPLFSRSVAPTPAVEALYATINSLKAGSPVLVAFDYDPTTSDELNVIAQTIVGHLMDRGARVVAVSLLPAGPATAESLLQSLAAGRPYVNLGYLPGDIAAIRLIGQSLQTAQVRDYQGTPVADVKMMDGITTIQDFDLLIDLTGSQNSLRWWIEQLGTPYGIPMGAGVSAAIDPFALAYYETPNRQLRGVVGGVVDAAQYDARLSGQQELEGPLAVRLDAQLVGHGVLVLVLLVGNVVFLVQRGIGRNP